MVSGAESKSTVCPLKCVFVFLHTVCSRTDVGQRNQTQRPLPEHVRSERGGRKVWGRWLPQCVIKQQTDSLNMAAVLLRSSWLWHLLQTSSTEPSFIAFFSSWSQSTEESETANERRGGQKFKDWTHWRSLLQTHLKEQTFVLSGPQIK